MDSPYFFQMSFFSTKCASVLLKIENDFNIDNLKGKSTWIDKFLKNRFEHIWLKNTFDFENMDWENMFLTKVIHVYVIKGMNV
jgi:hypothetical protein